MSAWMLLLSLAIAADPATGPPERPVVEQATPPPPEPGSLWNEVSARQLVGLDGNARQVGDLITVHIVEQSQTELDASTNLSKASNSSGAIGGLLGLDKRALKALKYMDQLGFDGQSAAEFAGSGDTTRGSEVQAVITCEVIDVLPNGNLRIWGTKEFKVNRETQYITLDGVLRPRDIQMDNTIRSELLAYPNVQITGSGVIADKQGPGWLARVLDFIWPF